MTTKSGRKPNIVLFGIDSLRADRMSVFGYDRDTTPHLARFAEKASSFENHFSPHIPTTSGYANMLTGMDCFNTNIVGAIGNSRARESTLRVSPVSAIFAQDDLPEKWASFADKNAKHFGR